MPVPPGTRYRVKITKSGGKVRLAFHGDQVVEAKKLGPVNAEPKRETPR
jgi:hypothetical protein